jgi:hypothetical protein
MRRTTVGFAVLALSVFGGFVRPDAAGAVSRCTLSFNVNLMPRPAVAGTVKANGSDPRLPVVDCQGRRSGPRDGLAPNDLIPDFDFDVDVVS